MADDAEADITGQTAQVLAQVDRLLDLAGSDKTRILMAQVRPERCPPVSWPRLAF